MGSARCLHRSVKSTVVRNLRFLVAAFILLSSYNDILVAATGSTDDQINNIQINTTPSGMPYFLLIFIFALIFGIPIGVKVYDKYLKALLVRYIGIAQVSNKNICILYRIAEDLLMIMLRPVKISLSDNILTGRPCKVYATSIYETQ
jgi:hypothetical protein